MAAEQTQWIEAIICLEGGHDVRGYFASKEDFQAFYSDVNLMSNAMHSVSASGRITVRPSKVVKISLTAALRSL